LTAIVAFGSAASILVRMVVGANNISSITTNYGFPLTFGIVYGPPIPLSVLLTQASALQQFHVRALAFDVIFATVGVVSCVFSIDRWSASWTTRGHAAFYLICMAIWIPWVIELPILLALLFLVVFLAGSLIVIVCSCIYSTWCCATCLLGIRLRPLAFFLVPCSFIGFAYWAYPHDLLADPTSADLPTLLELRSSDDPYVRVRAVDALSRVAVNDERVIEALIASISDENRFVREKGMSVAPLLGPAAARAVPALVEALQDDKIGFLAAGALARIGPPAKEAIPALRQELQTAEGYEKLNICKALWSIEEAASEVVPALIELLNDDFDPIRRDAASLLGKIGPLASAAVPTLVKMVQYVPPPEQPSTADSSSRPASARVVQEPPGPTTRRMTDLEFYPQIRSAAAEALSKIDPQAAAMARRLVE
jgi:HEAT repeat protein